MRQLKIEERKTQRTRSVDAYFNDLNRRSRITAQEEMALATRARQGDQLALNKLVEANLRFVVSVAKQYTHDAALLPDLISQGNLGLIEAAHKYDPTTGFKFISYAVWFIRKEILLYYNSVHNLISMPVTVEIDLRRIKKVESELEMKLERKPSADELIKELAVTGKAINEDKLQTLLKEEVSAVTIDSKKDDDDFALIDLLGVQDCNLVKIENLSDDSVVSALLSVLNPVELDVVTRVLGLGDSEPARYKTIEETLGKYEGWARMTYMTALRKMTVKYNKLKKKR